MEAINYEMSGGSFNVRRRRLATFTMTSVAGKIVVSDDRPSHVRIFYRDTEFDSVEAAVAYWGRIDETRIIMG